MSEPESGPFCCNRLSQLEQRVAELEAELSRVVEIADAIHDGAFSPTPKHGRRRPILRVLKGGKGFLAGAGAVVVVLSSGVAAANGNSRVPQLPKRHAAEVLRSVEMPRRRRPACGCVTDEQLGDHDFDRASDHNLGHLLDSHVITLDSYEREVSQALLSRATH
jgi:hypothetical protein